MIIGLLLLAGVGAAALATVRARPGAHPSAPVPLQSAASRGASAGRSWGVARAIARVEGRRLLRSPLVLAGLGLPLLMIGADSSETVDLHELSIMTGFMSLLPAAATLIAANLAAVRARRDGAEELYGVTPPPAVARTGGQLLALLWPAAASLVIPGAALARAHLWAEPFGALDYAEAAVGPLLVAGAGGLGVLLARWLPSPVAAPLACVAIAVFELTWNGGFVAHSGWRWMAFWLQSAGEFPSDLLPGRPAGWHAVYLTALVVAAAVGAMLRHGLTRRLGVVGAIVVSVAAVSAWAQGRPPSAAAWAAANARIANPAAHQVCEQREGVRYCAYPRYRPLIDHWAADVAGVLRQVPASARTGELEVSQRLVPSNDMQYVGRRFHAQLSRRLPALPPLDTPVPDDGALHPPMSWDWDGQDVPDLGLALGAASWAVGLPLAPPGPHTVCDRTGQGRSVVALWLAAQATPETEEALRFVATRQAKGRLVVIRDGWDGAMALGRPEIAHALALLERPREDVAAAVARDWPLLTAPSATTDEVANRLGLQATSEVVRAEASSPFDADAVSPDLRLGPSCARMP